MRHWLHVLGLRVLGLQVLGMVLGAVLECAAAAQAPVQAKVFDIAAVSAPTALAEFGRQSGCELLFDYDSLSSFRTNAVKGTYSPARALELLLAHTGLEAVDMGSGILLIEITAARELPLTPASPRESEVPLPRAAQTREAEIVEMIIVTGSHIRGSVEDAALPVDVISTEELQNSGSPSTVEVLKNLSVSAGALGDTNQFATGAQGTEGTGSVNLRNLGRQRTLVLLNGRRLVNAPQSGAPDTNLIPQAAIGRIEVLKDGAAATYGSDAIAGVVNFITNDRLEGLQIGGSYEYIEDTAGDYDSSVSYGWQGERSSLLAVAGYQHRSELRVTQRSFARSSYLQNPQSFSAAGNPGTFALPNGAAAPVILADPGCATLGGIAGETDTSVPVCYFNFVPFDNLVEQQEQYQGYLEYDRDLGESTKLHIEGFYSQTDVPSYRTSPAFLANQVPTTGAGPGHTTLAGRFVIPNSNPGVRDFIAQNPTLVGSLPAAARANLSDPSGILIDLNPLFRPFGVGGNPATGSANLGSRTADAFRLSAGMNGEIAQALKWDVAVTYMENRHLSKNHDIPVARLQAALQGFGGFECTGTQPGQNGCLYYNPFSSAIAKNAIDGQVNPNFVASSANSAELARFLFGSNDLDRRATQIVVDAVFSGRLGLALPGGAVNWAAGLQFREDDFSGRYGVLNNYAVNPCVDPGDRSCLIDPASGAIDKARATGIFMFLGGGFDVDLTQNVHAAFGEISLPVLDSLALQIAARYEDYGGRVGNSLDPKLSVRWQATDWLALRGSIGTSFRGPPASILVPNAATTLAFSQQAGGFRAVRIFGNPDLNPESARTFNVGLLFNAAGLRASLDYFNYDFANNFTVEDFTAVISDVFSGPRGGANCASVVAARIAFNPTADNPTGACVDGAPATQLNAVSVKSINSGGLEQDGLDLIAEYTFNDVIGGALGLGINASYVLNFDVNAQLINGAALLPAFDGAGFSNVNTGFTPLPELKGTAFLELNRGRHNLRWTTRYVDSYIDSRSLLEEQRNIFTAKPSTGGLELTAGRRIDSHLTHDLTYVLELPSATTWSATISNLTDADPPFARLELSYDPSTVSPLGRTVKVGVRKRF